jgi:hypothetical protein
LPPISRLPRFQARNDIQQARDVRSELRLPDRLQIFEITGELIPASVGHWSSLSRPTPIRLKSSDNVFRTFSVRSFAYAAKSLKSWRTRQDSNLWPLPSEGRGNRQADNGRVECMLRPSVDLVSGRFAVMEKSREFTLVPWRPVLERQLGKLVSGIMRSDGISWSIGHWRSGPSID